MSVRRPLLPALVAATLITVDLGAITAQTPIDETYTARIREYTTETFFSTPYVDHLPASTTVPTPLDVLGHIAGAPNVLTYPSEINAYMRAVARTTPRVAVFGMGQSEEGREMIIVAVSDSQTIANLDSHKEMMRRLGDPRVTSEAEAEELSRRVKPMYWATGAIHSPETGSPEMLMELVYRLAVDEGNFIRTIRDSAIILVTPVIEVDGRAKVVDLHMAKHQDSLAPVPSRPIYWGKYVAHDNNRDGIGLSLALSRNVIRTFLEYRPVVMHDLHESASHLYTSTGRGPYNAWVDPIVINEWNNLAYKEVREMTALGVPGVYTHDFYDGWAPNYMMFVSHLHNGIGRFYETQGAGNASTRIQRATVEREWHRPNTPLPEFLWSIRNNVNLQQSAILIAMNHVAEHRSEFLRNYYRKAQRAVAKAAAEGPAAYVLPAGERRGSLQARLLRLLNQHGFELHRLDEDVEIGEDQEFPRGSYVVRMDQPYSRGADMLLDKQYYNPNDPRPYDDVGWTLGPLFDVTTVRVEDPEILSARMTLVEEPVFAAGGVERLTGGRAAAYLIDYRADNRLASFRFAHPELRIEAAESAFEVEDVTFNAGSFIVRAATADDENAELEQLLDQAGRELEFVARRVSRVPNVATHPVQAPRVAVVHTWTSTQSEGWLRIGFDEYGIPYDYISVHDVRDDPDLRAKYDVLVMGPSSLDALSLMRGVQGERPIRWMPGELTPNIGRQAQTEDMRGGFELQGIVNLWKFVEDGGTFLTISSSASVPIHFGMVDGMRIKDTPNLWARGGVFRAQVADTTSPLVYGYADELGVYFNTAPVFAAVQRGRRRFGGSGSTPAARGGPGSTTERRTGRGGVDEEDVVQGRPRNLGAEAVEAFRNEHGEESEQSPFAAEEVESRTRTVMRYSGDVEGLLISGGILNGREMANEPALVDAPLGDGHVILFSFNPFWRGETVGSYALVFNALLHHGYLDTGSDGAEPEVTPEAGS